MTMNSIGKNICTFFILTGFFLASCVEDVDISMGQEKKVVVNCLLVKDSIQELTLNYSAFELYSDYEPIKEAKATLWSKGDSIGEFKRSENNKWLLKHMPKPYAEYTLKVEVPGRDTISATTIFPRKPYIRRVEANDKENSYGFVKQKHEVFWVFANPYQGLSEIGMPIKQPVLISPIGSNLLDIDSFNIDLRGTHMGNYPVYHHYLRVLPGEYEQYFEVSEIVSAFVVFRGVSNEYDQYLKSILSKMLAYSIEDDPKLMLDETMIYSNIKNGVGIFGAYNDIEFCCFPVKKTQ